MDNYKVTKKKPKISPPLPLDDDNDDDDDLNGADVLTDSDKNYLEECTLEKVEEPGEEEEREWMASLDEDEGFIDEEEWGKYEDWKEN